MLCWPVVWTSTLGKAEGLGESTSHRQCRIGIVIQSHCPSCFPVNTWPKVNTSKRVSLLLIHEIETLFASHCLTWEAKQVSQSTFLVSHYYSDCLLLREQRERYWVLVSTLFWKRIKDHFPPVLEILVPALVPGKIIMWQGGMWLHLPVCRMVHWKRVRVATALLCQSPPYVRVHSLTIMKEQWIITSNINQSIIHSSAHGCQPLWMQNPSPCWTLWPVLRYYEYLQNHRPAPAVLCS